MTNAQSTMAAVSADASSNKRRKISPPIPLARPEKKSLRKDEYATHKLRTVPGDADSPTYDFAIPFFSTGTCEEWLITQRNLRKLFVGLNATNGPARFRLARTVLKDKAETSFETAAQGLTETNENLEQVLMAVTRSVFPPRAAQQQKRWMRRYMRKPADVKIREHVARVEELNAYLPQFPPAEVDGEAIQSLPRDELCDDLDYGNPNSWQRQMVLHDFDPLTHTPDEFVAFCERLERFESLEPKAQAKAKSGKSRKRGNPNNTNNSPNSSNSGGKVCMLHGNVPGSGNHSTEECKVLQAQAKRMKATYNAQTPSGKKKWKEQHELNAMVADAIKDALHKRDAKKRKRRELAAAQCMHEMESLSLADSGAESSCLSGEESV